MNVRERMCVSVKCVMYLLCDRATQWQQVSAVSIDVTVDGAVGGQCAKQARLRITIGTLTYDYISNEKNRKEMQ